MLHATWNNRESNPLFGEPLPKGFLIFPFYRMLKKITEPLHFTGQVSFSIYMRRAGMAGTAPKPTPLPFPSPPPLVVVVVLLSWSEVSVQGGCMYTV